MLSASGSESADTHTRKTVGPIATFDVRTLDPARAAGGEALFQQRCAACHRMDEKLIGPALAGVTQRRQPEWILNYIMRTDIMLDRDPVAMELLESFLTRMTDQHVSQRDAESILAYFLAYEKRSSEGAALLAGATPSKGVGPITHIDLTTLDASRAAQGESLFRTRCAGCHKLEERYIGPALTGVTRRRQPEWIMNMILGPEVMLKQDPVAMELLTRYMTPMANQHLTPAEAEAVLVYFREHDKSLPAGVTDEPSTQPVEKVKKGPPGTN